MFKLSVKAVTIEVAMARVESRSLKSTEKIIPQNVEDSIS